MVLLREALSSETTPLAKLVRIAKNNGSSIERRASVQVNEVDPDAYRMNRKLSSAERAQLVELYQAGASALELARQFNMHRQTVARQLIKAGVELRGQLKRTPQLTEQAKKLYAEGHSTTEIAKQLGVEASTVGRALKRAGVTPSAAGG